MKAALLLLALVGLAAARCPEGMVPILEDEMDAAAEIGLNSWAISAKEQWCDFFPEAINAAGFEYYNTTITPTCKSEDGTYHFTVESKNPCDEDFKFYVGFMDVATNSTDCPQTWVEADGFNGTVTAQPYNESTFEPLECEGAYRPAFEDELDVATQLLFETVIQPDFQGRTAGQFEDFWYCDGTPGYKRLNVTQVSACFAKTRDFPPKIQAKGEVEWVCAQQARIRRIELRVDTPFVLQCEWQVDIQMGDTPEVPQPDEAEKA